MIIDVAILKDGESREVESDYDPKELDLEFDDFHFTTPLRLTGRLDKVSGALVFSGNLGGKVERICARCVEPVKGSFRETFNLTYEVKHNDVIDTTPQLRETVILAHPMRFLCRSECRGLCPVCGANLNHSKCNHPVTNVRAGFAELEPLKDKLKEKAKKR